ncbi:hypothetical protein TWF192_010898 [Orbilia oligospora]|uniref:Uncharacterized protein n=1 Tax=Orbilia oligospora TaxID=2813651 RepID=A0A6G1LXD6_ORBOL|nr:hypothetical protein TWF679_007946 [Orbilia oligospora]KAF3237358.1 hypothetical protein TWF192_010898 [Orbilia oligospora]
MAETSSAPSATVKKIAPMRSPKVVLSGSKPAPGPVFTFDFKAPSDTFYWEATKIPSKAPPNNANTSRPNQPAMDSTGKPHTRTVAIPPWKATENLPSISPPSEFRIDLLTANLQYLNKTYETCQSAHNWTLAHQCLLKMVKIMKRQSLNALFPNNAARTKGDTPAFSATLDELEIKLFLSHLRLGEYEEAWGMLPAIKFSSKSNPEAWRKAYEEILTTAGWLSRALETEAKISEAPSAEHQNQRSLFYQIKLGCGKAIDATIDGGVDMYGRPAKYQLYAIMAIIEHANQNQDAAVFWKTLIIVDDVDIEKDLASFPLLAKWIEKYNTIQDATFLNQAEEARQNLASEVKGNVDSQPEDRRFEFSDGTTFSELKEQLAWNLNEIKAILKQGLQDLRTERHEIEELKNEIKELKEEWETDIDMLRDEVDELRDEFGDRLLEELEEGLDPELSVGLRLESVRIANGRITEMNKAVKEKLNKLEAELTASKPLEGSSRADIEQLGLD